MMKLNRIYYSQSSSGSKGVTNILDRRLVSWLRRTIPTFNKYEEGVGSQEDIIMNWPDLSKNIGRIKIKAAAHSQCREALFCKTDLHLIVWTKEHDVAERIREAIDMAPIFSGRGPAGCLDVYEKE